MVHQYCQTHWATHTASQREGWQTTAEPGGVGVWHGSGWTGISSGSASCRDSVQNGSFTSKLFVFQFLQSWKKIRLPPAITGIIIFLIPAALLLFYLWSNDWHRFIWTSCVFSTNIRVQQEFSACWHFRTLHNSHLPASRPRHLNKK